jgi:TolB protein
LQELGDLFLRDKALLWYWRKKINWQFACEVIAFSSGRTGFKDESALHPCNSQPYGEICVMHADGSDVRVLTDNQFEEATPAWMPLRKEIK